jgi:serine/threonine-protein kinase
VKQRDIFHAAMEIADPVERSAYLDEQCAGDSTLREHLEGLLEMQPQLGSFLESPAVELDDAGTPPLNAGRFQLGEELARGGMGVVYRARDESLERDAAVKVLHERYRSDFLVGQRFLNEARITAQLQHPGIPPVFEVGQLADGRPYLAMKLIMGRTLEALLRERPGRNTDRSRFVSVFQQICQAVGYAHSKQILHRDLKPANVMVGAFGEVQVMDWGLAKMLHARDDSYAPAGETESATMIRTNGACAADTEAGSILGTPAYMSPEQAGGNLDRLDERGDVFGLGAILCVILTGQPPYVGTSDEEIRTLAIRGDLAPAYTRLEECGADAKLIDLCRQCLSADRDERPRDGAAVAAAISEHLAGVEERARRAEVEWAAAQARAVEQRKRRRVQLFLAAMVLACVVLVGFGLSWREHIESAAQSERALRESRTSAGVAEALREARARTEEAWGAADFPERMHLATDAALTAIRRADDFVQSGAATETTLAELAAAREAVVELSRHTRLITTCDRNVRQFANELTGQGIRVSELRLMKRYADAFRQFGLDPMNSPVDEVAQAVAGNRLRDWLLGYLLDWHWYTKPKENPLGQVISATRRLCGGAYARWQEISERGELPELLAFAASPDALSFRGTVAKTLGRTLRAAGDYAACRDFLRVAIARHPHDAWLRYDFADVCCKIKPHQYAEALRHISVATAQRPDSALFQMELGDCYNCLKSYDRAMAAYQQAIALAPDAVLAYVRLGKVLANKKDWQGAIATFKEAIRLRPKYAAAHVILGATLVKTGKHAEALQVLLAAMREHPKLAAEPRTTLRYSAARYSMNCALGLGLDAPPPEERPAYRKQALAFLNADLAAMQKLAAKDPAYVNKTMRLWLANKDLARVRGVAALKPLPPAERNAWNKLWKESRALRNQTAPESVSSE